MKSKPNLFRIVLALLITAFSLVSARAQSNHAVTGYVEVEECVVRLAKEVNVPSLQTGRVDEVAIQLNDLIKRDQELARLDDRSLLIRRNAAQLRARVAREQSEDTTEIEFAEVALSEATEEFENSRSISKDARGVIPDSEIRRMRLAVKRAKLEVTQAIRRKERATVEADSLAAELAMVDDQLKHLHCVSPINGVVLDLARNEGEWIAKGETIAKIGMIDRIHVHALISSQVMSRSTCRGLPVSVHWTDQETGLDQSLRGRVLSIDPQQFPGGRYRIHAEIVNQRHGTSTRRIGDAERLNGLRDRRSVSQPSGWLLIPGTVVKMRVYTSGESKSTVSRSSRNLGNSQR